MLKIAIITATYNRADTLPRLYQSLLMQTLLPSLWIIVDDGSIDNTDQLIGQWVADGKIPIIHLRQSNGGKHRAINRALAHIDGTEYVMIVDSDDYLPNDSLSTISHIHSKYRGQQLSGIVSLKSDTNGNILDGCLPNAKDMSWGEIDACGLLGERTLVFHADTIRHLRFPEIQGEKFCTEAVLYNQIRSDAIFAIVNVAMTVCRYHDDGLTANLSRLMARNPTGYKIYFSQQIDKCQSTAQRWLTALKYGAFCRLSQDKTHNYNGIHTLPVKTMQLLSYPIAQYYKLRCKS